MKEVSKIDVHVEDYLDKMKPEDSAFITSMCLGKLCAKAQELKDLYMQLAKTYGIEMGLTDITCIVQISSPILSPVPAQGFLGTVDGIKNGLASMMTAGIKELARMKKEEACPNDDKEQD